MHCRILDFCNKYELKSSNIADNISNMANMHSIVNSNRCVDSPNKRRRESMKHEESTNKYKGYENAPVLASSNKENNYMSMEIKSIAQMIADKTIENPFEVVRKPPKKKKKSDIEDSCFVNPALNLNGAEIALNPYEIKRAPIVVQDDLCFINSGLNIRVPDKQQETSNGFEIVRNSCGIENPGLDLEQPTPRAIAVPFTPNMGCRINFKDIPLDSLTPCSMLTNKLVLTSPNVTNLVTTPKRSTKTTAELSIISEEALNIGEELDCYQLELENSINEAKVDKSKKNNGKDLMDLKRKSSFVKRLELTEEELNETEVTPPPQSRRTNSVDEIENRDVVFEEIDETNHDEFEFTNPAPFVRTYRRSTRKPIGYSTIKAGVNNSTEPKGKISGFRSSIRKSIRKLMSNHPVDDCKPAVNEPSESIFTTLRQSFRKKTVTSKTALIDDDVGSQHDVSILMDVDRKVFKQVPNVKHNDEALKAFGRKTSLRSSFRNTTKDVRRHVMKSVFKKNVEDYCLD